jgi:two-component system, NarL family, nitrate/nitrite response regulator NarL
MTAPDKLRVILVDDQPLVRDLLKVRLHLDGRFAVVAEATSGGEALMFARVHRPDVIVLDVGMPGISGLTVLPAMAEECPDTKIVVYTATNDANLEQEAFARGADFVADKLMNVNDLIVAIAALCGRDGEIVVELEASDTDDVTPADRPR